MVRRKVHQTQCHETWMRWNDFYERQRLQHNSIILSLEPRAQEKICVRHVLNARGAVCCSVQKCQRPNSTTEYKAQRLAQARTEANTARNNSGQRHNGLERQQQPPATSCQAVNPQTRPKASRWQGNNVRATPRQPSFQGRGQTRSGKTQPARKNQKKGTRHKQQRETHQTNRTPAPGNSKSIHKDKPVAQMGLLRRPGEAHRCAIVFQGQTHCLVVSSGFLWGALLIVILPFSSVVGQMCAGEKSRGTKNTAQEERGRLEQNMKRCSQETAAKSQPQHTLPKNPIAECLSSRNQYWSSSEVALNTPHNGSASRDSGLLLPDTDARTRRGSWPAVGSSRNKPRT